MRQDKQVVLVTGAVDGQRKGTEAIGVVYHEKQATFLRQMGLEDLVPPSPLASLSEEITE